MIQNMDLINKMKLIMQLVEGCRYFHYIGIIHRDLKLGNILLHNDKIKITDFGFADEVSS